MRGQVDPVFVDVWQELPTILAGLVRPDDVILTMGAGNVGHIATQLPELLAEALEHRATSAPAGAMHADGQARPA
jgi:UDP-N-acetylmuramate--alanine ligase